MQMQTLQRTHLSNRETRNETNVSSTYSWNSTKKLSYHVNLWERSSMQPALSKQSCGSRIFLCVPGGISSWPQVEHTVYYLQFLVRLYTVSLFLFMKWKRIIRLWDVISLFVAFKWIWVLWLNQMTEVKCLHCRVIFLNNSWNVVNYLTSKWCKL